MDENEDYHYSQAVRILRDLTGRRWQWPPMRVVDRYSLPSSGTLRLAARPVREVYWVRDSNSGASIDHETTASGVVLMRGCRSKSVDVSYSYGCEMPESFERAASTLAREFRLAEDGDDSCRLPDRITSITREGVTWSLIDPNELLSEGRTGIYEIDLLLRSAGRPAARAKIFSGSAPTPLRLSAEELLS